jgi:hypothetical protein
MSRKFVLLFAVFAVALAACQSETGEGTLRAIIDEEGETAGFGDFSTGRDKSFGIYICSEGGSVQLDSIEPMHTEGDIEFLGGLIYTSSDMFVGAAHGFPPDGLELERTEPLEGATVDSACDSPSGDERVQLLVGVERTGAGGGVVDGLRVETSGGPVEIPFIVLLCGDRFEYCEALQPAPSTTQPEATTTSP